MEDETLNGDRFGMIGFEFDGSRWRHPKLWLRFRQDLSNDGITDACC